MKKQKQSATVYTLDREALNSQLSKNNSFNWVLELGSRQFEEGKVPSKQMATFMQMVGVLSIKNK